MPLLFMLDLTAEKGQFMDFASLQPASPLPADARVLVIVAHHDDIEFGVGGSVARWVRAGARVSYVIVTDGGAGSNNPTHTRAWLVAEREREQRAAAAALGVQDVRFLGYPDGILQPTLELRKALTRILREVKPYRVVCQDPTTVYVEDSYINHPDHRAAGEAATYAVFPSSETRPIFPELLEEGLEPHKVSELYVTLTTKPMHYVDISDVMADKLAALREHVTQIGAGATAENGALKWVSEYDARSGQRVGVAAAEFYRVMKFDRDNGESV